jgi:hypothetical protein
VLLLELIYVWLPLCMCGSAAFLPSLAVFSWGPCSVICRVTMSGYTLSSAPLSVLCTKARGGGPPLPPHQDDSVSLFQRKPCLDAQGLPSLSTNHSLPRPQCSVCYDVQPLVHMSAICEGDNACILAWEAFMCSCRCDQGVSVCPNKPCAIAALFCLLCTTVKFVQ